MHIHIILVVLNLTRVNIYRDEWKKNKILREIEWCLHLP